ncbi:unnamed protein product, partial [Rotaria sp. Silwood2]
LAQLMAEKNDREIQLHDFEEISQSLTNPVAKDLNRLKIVHMWCSVRAIQTQYDRVEFIKENWTTL